MGPLAYLFPLTPTGWCNLGKKVKWEGRCALGEGKVRVQLSSVEIRFVKGDDLVASMFPHRLNIISGDDFLAQIITSKTTDWRNRKLEGRRGLYKVGRRYMRWRGGGKFD